MRSLADRDGLRGRAKQARADALPEVSVYGTFLRYQDPGFFNSPNIDEFPPEILQAFRPIASNLWDGYASVRQTLWSFSLGKAIRAAGYAEHLGEENVRSARQDMALRAIFAYNAYLLALEQVKVAEKVVRQKEKQLEMARNRRGAGVATDLEVLRFEVDLANARTTLLRLRGAADLARGRPQRGHGGADRQARSSPTDTLEFVEAGGRAAGGRPRGDRQPARGEGGVLEREDLRRGDRHLQGRHAAPPRLQRRLRVVGAGHRELLRAQLQEVEPRRHPEGPGLRRLAHRGQGRAGPRRPREGGPGPRGPRDPHRPRGEAGGGPPAGRRERLPRRPSST